ncbi:MAG: autoinducer-2 kinase [Sarcina sp.]
MKKQYLMALDAGTGSVRCVIFDTHGKEISSASKEWFHTSDENIPGSMNFDVNTNWNLTLKCIKKAIFKANISPNDILAISTTSMREGIVLYDENKIEIWACANVDSRAENEVVSLNKDFPNLEKEIYDLSGQTFSLGAIPRLIWVKKHLLDIYKRTKFITMFNDWLIFKLSGELSVEPSNGCTTGMFNIKDRSFDREIFKKCNLNDKILPIVYESGTPIGKITEKCHIESGLSKNTLVVIGGGDAQLGCVGLSCVDDNQIAVLGGSFWQVEQNTIIPKTDAKARIRVNCHSIPHIFQYEAIAFYPGLIMRWFRDSFCDLELENEKITGVNVYDQMNEKAKKIPPGSNGVLCTFSNIMDYIDWKHASPTFTNFSLDATKCNKYSFYRSILENAAYVTKGHLNLIEEITNIKQSSIIFAGGASKSDLWCQIIADVLNVNVKIPVIKEATALGCAICAGVGAGIYKDISSASKSLVIFEKEFSPNISNVEIYKNIYETWLKLYKKNLEIADSGLVTHMWKAPGI